VVIVGAVAPPDPLPELLPFGLVMATPEQPASEAMASAASKSRKAAVWLACKSEMVRMFLD
jgi:hypothetical protein